VGSDPARTRGRDRTLPLLAVLVVPLLFGVHDLYLWARPPAVASDALLRHKSLYLNVPFFVLRTGVYFCGLARRSVFLE